MGRSTVVIDYSNLKSVYNIGYEGDNDITQLTIKPHNMGKADYYKLHFELEKEVYSTDPLYLDNGVINYVIKSNLTAEQGYIRAQLASYQLEGHKLVKQGHSEIIRLYIANSI